MKLLDVEIECGSRSDRVEIFPFGDAHIAKQNCDEHAINKQIAEVLKRSQIPGRHVRVFLGGDNTNSINLRDLKRFDFGDMADWFMEGKAMTIKERLSDMVNQEVERAAQIFSPLKPFLIGALCGNHEKSLMKQHNIDVHKMLCEKLETVDLTSTALIRFRFKIRYNKGTQVSTVQMVVRHGYGSGRSPGAEPNKLAQMQREWETADVCLTGHTHTFCIAPPKPVLYVPNMGKIPNKLLQRYRHAGNWGCWLLSHMVGPSSYEEDACYEAKPMMTLKVVIWPFWSKHVGKQAFTIPKIELRQYPLL